MTLSRVERERISDSRLKLQVVKRSLHQVDPKKVPDFEDIQECLEDAEESLDGALREGEGIHREEGGPRE